MRYLVLCLALVAGAQAFAVPARADDPGHINAYVTPYYNSTGPAVSVGKYSSGLASKNQAQFVATIHQMKKSWRHLDFTQLYAGAIRLYDLGYRQEAIYWFYTAQYQGRLYGLLVDQQRFGGMGDPGFELFHASNAFFQVVGPDINGYAFNNIPSLVATIHRVLQENKSVPNMGAIYPGIAFIDKSQWQSNNAKLNSGLGRLATELNAQQAKIEQQRASDGTKARFAHLTNKPLPS